MNFGFEITDPKEILIWKMYNAYQQGISPNEFRKCNMDDLNDVLDIKKSVDKKIERERKVRNAMSRI